MCCLPGDFIVSDRDVLLWHDRRYGSIGEQQFEAWNHTDVVPGRDSKVSLDDGREKRA